MIELMSVSHRFGEREVLRDVSVTLTEDRIGIIGSNGSGKSTLARLLNGLVVPDQGTVVIQGLDTRRQGAAIRRRVGFMFTDPDAQIVMPTVAEDVAFSLRRSPSGTANRERQVDAVLRRFGLHDHRDHPAHLLSGGQKQLLALAAILVTEPEVLVCDEPTTLLDLRNTRLFGRVVAELSQQVIIVTHDLPLLRDVDRVLVMDDGRIVADDEPAAALRFYEQLMASDSSC